MKTIASACRGTACTSTMFTIAMHSAVRFSIPKGTMVHALDFSAWKRRVLRQCFPEVRLVFTDNASGVPAGDILLVWGMKPIAGNVAPGVRILRLEDGFLRSVGLGADLIKPMSWVIDSQGIYYDATRPSDLESLLANTRFSKAVCDRAAALTERLVAENLTKYNTGNSYWERPDGAARVILVPGQVESDASLAYGAPAIKSNLGLLQAVRLANPEAYLIYKPHPDVLAGLRARGAKEETCTRYCDELLTHVSMGELLTQVDEVHVLTSLTGFEALLRRRPVTCYGQPFYAGWGLTTDIVPIARRTRQLTLEELVAGALIDYPLYLSRTGNALLTPEQALDELLAWRQRAGTAVPWWRHCLRVILRLVVGVR